MELRLSCSSLIDGKVTKAPNVMIPLSEIILIDSIDITKNDRRLRVRAFNGDYVFNLTGALSILEDMLSNFGFWRADNSNLINMTNVDKVVNSLFKPEVIFHKTNVRGEIAGIKIRALKKLFPDIPLVASLAI